MKILFKSQIILFILIAQLMLCQHFVFSEVNNSHPNLKPNTVKSNTSYKNTSEAKSLDKTAYLSFIQKDFPRLFSHKQLHKIKSAPFYNDSGVNFSANVTFQKYFNYNKTLFNAWTMRRAARLYKSMSFWQNLQQGSYSDKIIDEKIKGKFPSMPKKIIGIGDVHGDLNQLIMPLIREGICKVTGSLIFYNTKEHRRATTAEITNLTHKTIKNYILIPELKITKGIEKTHLVQMVGDLLDRGEWTDECYFLFEDLVNRAPDGLIQFCIGNHDAPVISNHCLELPGYIYTRKDEIQSGYKKLISENKVKIINFNPAQSAKDGGIIATHTFIEKNFIKLLLDNLDKQSAGSYDRAEANKLKEKQASLDLLDYIGNQPKYAKINLLLEKIIASATDYQITFTTEELQLFTDFLNDIFKQSFLTDNKKIIRNIFWIQTRVKNSFKPHYSTTILLVKKCAPGQMVNIPSMYGHIGGKERYTLYIEGYSDKHALRLHMEAESSYGMAAKNEGYSDPHYFRVNTNGEVNTIFFKHPENIPILSESKIMSLFFYFKPAKKSANDFTYLKDLWTYLIKNGYINKNGNFTKKYKNIVKTEKINL